MKKNIGRSLCERASGLISAGTDGISISRQISELVDGLVREMFDRDMRGAGSGISLVAVGGYGRGEMAPFSDIDIMLLVRKRSTALEERAKEILYRLWDTGLTIGHSFRTPEECVTDAMEDIQTRTALMDARFLAGDPAVFGEFRRDAYQKILFKKRKEFLGQILREIEKREASYGGSVYLLQPNLKEGRGGLRAIQTRSWLSRVSLSGDPPAAPHLLSAQGFLLRARACLHILSGRRNDVLSFELQDAVARMLGLKDTRRFLASEIMMRRLYRKRQEVQESLRTVISLCSSQYVRQYLSIPADWSVKRVTEDFFVSKGEITVRAMDILKNQDKVLELFRLFAATGRKLSDQVREFLRERAVYYPFRKSPSRRAVGLFLEVLGSDRVHDTLREMHATGVLGRFIPEFGRLRHLVIHEPYHRYTVDEHTLIAIRNLEVLKKSSLARLRHLRELLGEVRQDTLFLSILLHDTGKAEGRGRHRSRMRHEEEGYSRIRDFLERAGFERRDRAAVEFLVKNHILLSRLALTRDPDAPETIELLAGAAENEENLKALYLMTYADMSAVNPEFWTDWKAYTLHELFLRARERLRGNRLYYHAIADPSLREFVSDMPGRYLVSNPPETIRSDYELAREIGRTPLSFTIDERSDGTAELRVVTTDAPGLFSRIVGVLGGSGLNILRARVFTGKSGLVIDKIIVSNWRDLWWEGIESRIGEALLQALGPVRAGERAPSRPATFRLPPGRFESFVEIDNEASEDCSVMEVFTPDRLGLLYDISAQLHALGVDIISAVINTEDGIAQDVFYLQEKGTKLAAGNTMDALSSVKAIASTPLRGNT